MILTLALLSACPVPSSTPDAPIDPALVAACAEAEKPKAPTEWHAVTPAHVQGAPCRRAIPFSAEEMEAFLKHQASSLEPPVNRSIHGISFENESPAMLRIFQALTTVRRFDPTPQRKFTSRCTKVRCALDEIFGKDVALRTAFIQAQFGANTSHLVRKDAIPFASAELDDIALGLSDWPDRTFPLLDPFLVTRMAVPSGGPKDLLVSANATVAVFDRWSSGSLLPRVRTIVHEMGHHLGDLVRLGESSAWRQAGGWIEKPRIGADGEPDPEFVLETPDRSVSEYGTRNPDEDMAEAVTAYRYNPRELLKRSPEKYALLRDVLFDGLEYTSPEACHPSKSKSFEVSRRLKKQLETPELRKAFVKTHLAAAFQKCGDEVLGPVGREMPILTLGGDAEQCLADGVLWAAAERAYVGSFAGESRSEHLPITYLSRRLRLTHRERLDLIVELKAEATRQLREKLRAGLVELEETVELLGEDYAKESGWAKACERSAAYIYQKLKEEDFDPPGNKIKFTTFNHRETIDSFYETICLRARNDASKLRGVFDRVFPEVR